MTEQDERREHDQGLARQEKDQVDEHASHVLRGQAHKHYLLVRYTALVVTILLLIQIAGALGLPTAWTP